LPEGAVWCQVRLSDVDAFWMAVYDWDVQEDWVSYNICQVGHWEGTKISDYGKPGHMLDVGANIGFHTFSFAQAGWTVTSFEPMQPNLLLMAATLCRNPSLTEKVHVNWFGLGTKNEECKLMAPATNVGDGFTRCDGYESNTPIQPDEGTFIEKGSYQVHRLDDVLKMQQIERVDVVKIDVEGYEAQVFAGAPEFLKTYRPRLIKSEVWMNMVGDGGLANGMEYLKMFEDAGYKFFSDARCKHPKDAMYSLFHNNTVEAVMCLP